MSKIKTSTDSTADIPKSFCEELNISVLPLMVLVEGKEYLDGVDISPAELYRVIDDAPIVYGNMTLNCKLLIGNYVKGSIYLNEDELDRYECIPYMTSDYPAAFLLGSEYRKDMIAMAEKLQEAGVEHILVDPLAEHGEERPHCFVANERIDPVAAEAFQRLTEFLKEKTK